jgi:zinc protease
MRRALFLLLILVSGMTSPAAVATPFPTTDMTLENGLRVLLVEQHRVPAVAHMLLIRAGASEDPRGKSGLAHYLEHLLFKGTEKMSETYYNQQIAALGGEHNAFTNADATAYYVLVSKENLPQVMALEAERFLRWNPKPDVYASERDVIIEERRLRTENQPSALLSEAMTAALFQNHPYHTPIIGWMHEMQQLTAQDAKDFFATYYQPKNATLLLVGDVTPDEARTLAEKYYGNWKNTRDVPERRWTSEPPQRASLTLRMLNPSVQQPLWRRYYEAPSLIAGETAQAVPLMLLSDMLGAEGTGLLYKALVATGKATELSVSYYPFSLGPESLAVSMIPAKGVTPEQLTVAYEAALQKILTSTALNAESLARAKTQLKAETIFARDGLEGQAFIIAQLVLLGLSPQDFIALPERIDEVTLEQVKTAASTVLVDAHAVTGYLLPDPNAPKAEAKPVAIQEGGLVH